MPTKRHDRSRGAPRSLRALTAVAALYALVLQALLGGIAALPVAGAPGLLCAQLADGDGGAPDERHPTPPHGHAGCCTAASHAPTPAPPPEAGPAVWPDRSVTRIGWRARGPQAARAPPHTLASARAPPVA